MRKKLHGRLAVVTGASSGIGLEFARCLARNGADLVMVSNERAPLASCAEAIAREHDVKAFPLTLDLTAPDAPQGLLVFLDSKGLDPSILINNAGIFSFDMLTRIAPARVDAFIDLHVRAVTQLSRLFAARFAARGGGHILNMSSMSCWMPMPGLSLYSATKAYIRVMSRSLHYEMRGAGVTVTVACPGGIATDLFGLPPALRKLAVRIKVLQTPEKFARNALRRMLRGKAQYINGGLNRLSILFVGMMPRPIRMLVKSELLDKGIRRP